MKVKIPSLHILERTECSKIGQLPLHTIQTLIEGTLMGKGTTLNQSSNKTKRPTDARLQTNPSFAFKNPGKIEKLLLFLLDSSAGGESDDSHQPLSMGQLQVLQCYESCPIISNRGISARDVKAVLLDRYGKDIKVGEQIELAELIWLLRTCWCMQALSVKLSDKEIQQKKIESSINEQTLGSDLSTGWDPLLMPSWQVERLFWIIQKRQIDQWNDSMLGKKRNFESLSDVGPFGFGTVHETRSETRGDNDSNRIIGIDCEMIDCQYGSVLARVTLVQRSGDKTSLIYDEYVKYPEDFQITDYKTKYSGITEEILREKARKTFGEIQKDLIDLISSDCILIGHAVENDLSSVGIMHRRIVDTSLNYGHALGPFRKPSLRFLTKAFLKRDIQSLKADSSGHDSFEDASASLDLALLKRKKNSAFGSIGKEAFRCSVINQLKLQSSCFITSPELKEVPAESTGIKNDWISVMEQVFYRTSEMPSQIVVKSSNEFNVNDALEQHSFVIKQCNGSEDLSACIESLERKQNVLVLVVEPTSSSNLLKLRELLEIAKSIGSKSKAGDEEEGEEEEDFGLSGEKSNLSEKDKHEQVFDDFGRVHLGLLTKDQK